jgi:hypothetical protein
MTAPHFSSGLRRRLRVHVTVGPASDLGRCRSPRLEDPFAHDPETARSLKDPPRTPDGLKHHLFKTEALNPNDLPHRRHPPQSLPAREASDDVLSRDRQ